MKTLQSWPSCFIKTLHQVKIIQPSLTEASQLAFHTDRFNHTFYLAVVFPKTPAGIPTPKVTGYVLSRKGTEPQIYWEASVLGKKTQTWKQLSGRTSLGACVSLSWAWKGHGYWIVEGWKHPGTHFSFSVIHHNLKTTLNKLSLAAWTVIFCWLNSHALKNYLMAFIT